MIFAAKLPNWQCSTRYAGCRRPSSVEKLPLPDSDRIFALKFFSGIYDRGILWVSSGIIRENEIIGRRISEYSDQSISSLFSAKIVSLKVLCGYARDHRAGRCAHRRTPSLAPEHPHDAGACVCTLIAMFSGLSSMANRTPQTASLCTRDLGFLRL